jgi:Fic family protein
MTFRFPVTEKMLGYCSEISLLLGRFEGLSSPTPQPQLRRSNRIKTIQGSLSIEGNTLSLDQVTALFGDKRVLGPAKDVQEVKNAIKAYERLKDYKIFSTASLREGHKILMQGLISDAGKWRQGQVGIIKGSKVSHVAPPAKRVPELMEALFAELKKSQTLHPLLRAASAHYEIEFIHPFSDGNGRIGRLWQAAHLFHYHPLFEFLSVESIVKKRQAGYYEALENSDSEGNAKHFIEFSLQTILESLEEFLDQIKPEPLTAKTRLEKAREKFGKGQFSRQDYLKFFKTLSTATASRDLKEGVAQKQLKKTGEQATTRYVFV